MGLIICICFESFDLISRYDYMTLVQAGHHRLIEKSADRNLVAFALSLYERLTVSEQIESMIPSQKCAHSYSLLIFCGFGTLILHGKIIQNRL